MGNAKLLYQILAINIRLMWFNILMNCSIVYF